MKININDLMTLLDDDETMFIEVEPKLQSVELTLVKWVDDRRKKISYYISFDELDHFEKIFTDCLEKLRKHK
jgi:hypothetical protein